MIRTILSFYLAVFSGIIIHEIGHLVFGLITGYSFLSFRVFSLALVRTAKGLKVKRFRIPGTSGQCLLAPPDYNDGNYELVLYNLGGVIASLIVSLICIILLLFQLISSLRVFCMMVLIVEIVFALVNGIPFSINGENNDGKNLIQSMESQESKYAFWLQLKINELLVHGNNWTDLPEEWFNWPTEDQMKSNQFIAALSFYSVRRMMCNKDFCEAEKEIKRMLCRDYPIPEIYRMLLLNDLIYCVLLDPMRKEEAKNLRSKEYEKFTSVVKSIPSVLRTQIVWLLVIEKNRNRAEELIMKLENLVSQYPYPREVQMELSLVAYLQLT